MTFASDEKWRPFKCFSVQGRSSIPTGSDPENGVSDQDMGAQVDQFLLGCKCRVSRGLVVQKQEHLGTFPRRSSFKMSFNCTSRDWLILRVDSLVFLEDDQ